MARFYFQTDAWGATFEDHQGIERADLEEARQAAALSARAFMHAEVAEGRPCGCCADVAKVAGSPVLTVRLAPLADGTDA